MAQDFTSEMKRTTDRVSAQGHSDIDDLRAQVKDLTDKYGGLAQDKYNDARNAVQQNMGEIEQQIRDKPVQATLIAAGVGFLVGAILFR